MTYCSHGQLSEVWLGIAYRRAKQFGAERQKIIKCPYCTNHLTVIDAAAKVEVYQYPKKKKTDVVCHEYRRCNSCRETVGILFAVG